MRAAIPSAEAATIRKLLRELPSVVWEATNASSLAEEESALAGKKLRRFRTLEERLVRTVTLIREIAEN